mgnify:CR=1 FL=1
MKKSVWLSGALGALLFSVSASFLFGSVAGSAGPIDAPGVVASNFKVGALAEAIGEEECTLTSGDKTTCYRITVTGEPVDAKIGPFCPETTSSTAGESGIWLDGSKVYDVDGAFILDLATIYGDTKWKLYDDTGFLYEAQWPTPVDRFYSDEIEQFAISPQAQVAASPRRDFETSVKVEGVGLYPGAAFYLFQRW